MASVLVGVESNRQNLNRGCEASDDVSVFLGHHKMLKDKCQTPFNLLLEITSKRILPAHLLSNIQQSFTRNAILQVFSLACCEHPRRTRSEGELQEEVVTTIVSLSLPTAACTRCVGSTSTYVVSTETAAS